MNYLTLTCLFCVTVLLDIPLSAGKGICRNLILHPIKVGKRLTSHIIKNVSVEMMEECNIRCFMENACVSYNLGPRVNGKRLCELSDSDHNLYPNDLVQEVGYGYRDSRNACASSPCTHFSRCLSGFGDDGYVCLCPPGYEGNRCQNDVDECSKGLHNCSQHAKCDNLDGSFVCACNSGYSGDGINCNALASYQTLGCFKDTGSRAIPTLEWQDPLLDGSYHARQNAIEKCYQAAKKRGFRVFAVQNGGWCASSATAEQTYNKYGPSSNCRPDGEGGGWANQVYEIQGI